MPESRVLWGTPTPSGEIKPVEYFSTILNPGSFEPAPVEEILFSAPVTDDEENASFSGDEDLDEEDDSTVEYYDVESARRSLEQFVSRREAAKEEATSAETAAVEEPVDPENLIEIDTEHLKTVLNTAEELGSEFKEVMLDFGASIQIAHDNAAAYTEAALGDGLGIETAVGSEMVPVLEGLVYIEAVSAALARARHITRSTKNKILTRLVDGVMDDSLKKMKAESMSKDLTRYKRDLDNPVGRADANSIGMVRRFSDGKAPKE